MISRSLLVAALLASVAMFPAGAHAAMKKHNAVKPALSPTLRAEPDALNPALSDADVDAHMTAGSAKDQPQSLFNAMRWAYDHNPVIRAARQGLMAAQEALPQAQSGWKPTAQANASVTKNWLDSKPSSTSDGSTAKDVGVSISQPLYRGGRTVSGITYAKNSIMAQRAALNATESQTMLAVVTAYMDVLRDQSLLDLAKNNRDVIAKQLEAVQARFKVGDVTRTDVSQAKARLAGAKSDVTAAHGNLRSSLAVYRQVVGTPAGRLSLPAKVLNIPDSLDGAIAMAMTYNPDVIEAQFSRDAARNNVDVIHGELLPTVSLDGSVSHSIDPSDTTDWQTNKSIGIVATIPLYTAGSVRSRIRQAKDSASQSEINVQSAKDSVRQLTVSTWETYRAAKSEILSRREQVRANKIASQGVHKEAELGTRTVLDALNADQELLSARSNLVTARRNEVVASYSLAAALGLLNPVSMGFPELQRDYNAHIDEITGKVFDSDTHYNPDRAKAGRDSAESSVNR